MIFQIILNEKCSHFKLVKSFQSGSNSSRIPCIYDAGFHILGRTEAKLYYLNIKCIKYIE